MRLIIFLPSVSRFAPAVLHRSFRWSDAHQAHIYEGRELTPEEFNRVSDDVLKREDYFVRPCVRVVMTHPVFEGNSMDWSEAAQGAGQSEPGCDGESSAAPGNYCDDGITASQVRQFIELKKRKKNRR